jgi:photosystem II stability/assembly factor-like uncharacterized protein
MIKHFLILIFILFGINANAQPILEDFMETNTIAFSNQNNQQWSSRNVSFVNADIGYSLAGYITYSGAYDNIFNLLRSTNAGRTWQITGLSITSQTVPGTPPDLFFLNESTGFIAVSSPNTGGNWNLILPEKKLQRL